MDFFLLATPRHSSKWLNWSSYDFQSTSLHHTEEISSSSIGFGEIFTICVLLFFIVFFLTSNLHLYLSNRKFVLIEQQ